MHILFIAPFHSQYDKRVSNSLKDAIYIFSKISILYDSNYNDNKIGIFENSFFYPLDIKSINKFKYPNLLKWVSSIKCQLEKCDIIYIHDSGIIGLFLSNILSKYGKPIVLDYHDNIYYEIYYQLKKNKLTFIFPFIKFPLKFIFKKFSKNINFLVGINEIQIQEFQKNFGYKNKSIVIDNNRNLFEKFIPNNKFIFNTFELVWIGNVMRGRDLELIVDFLRDESRYILNIFGNILDFDFKNEIKIILEDRVNFHGKFNDEFDILKSIKFNPIGIYLGWDDPFNTKINEMSSPNKIYSYINLSIPFIFSSKFINPYSILNKSIGIPINSGGKFKSQKNDFFLAIDNIIFNYDKYFNSIEIFRKKNSLEKNKKINQFEQIISIIR